MKTGAIGFLGFGEAAQAFLKGWRSEADFSERLVAYDIKTDSADAAVRAGKRADYAAWQVTGAASAPEMASDVDQIFSVVTADEAHTAAVAALPGLKPGAFFFDCDSCAPQTKARSAEALEAAGARYVDVAVMAPVHPRLHRTPLLISGPHSQAGADILRALGMAVEIHDGPVGAASAIKMTRSIMIKGLEALVCECLLAGVKLGVAEPVLASLEDTFPGFGWPERSAYMLERVMTHGVRRAAEMREVALMVDELGLDNSMASATVKWQQRIGDLRFRAKDVGEDYAARTAAVLKGLKS